MKKKYRLGFGIVLPLVFLGVGAYFVYQAKAPSESSRSSETVVPDISPTMETAVPSQQPREQVIGSSVEGRPIMAYTFGAGTSTLLFVGGIHGGYEWNSVLLAYEFIDYLQENSSTLPQTVSVAVIPSLNPDGVYAVVGKEGRFTLADIPEKAVSPGTGRFNAHNVDLNRNFACKWSPTSSWRGKTVSAGATAFSEPEASALRTYVETVQPAAAVFFHSQANAVYASECEVGVLPETKELMERYAGAAGYPAILTFDAYPVTGDAEGWLASIGIPAITVELETHESVEWEKNKAGLYALLDWFATKNVDELTK